MVEGPRPGPLLPYPKPPKQAIHARRAYVFGGENFTTVADAFDRDVDLQWHKGSSFR